MSYGYEHELLRNLHMKTLPAYKYNGAQSLVLLHDNYMKSFLLTWQKAKEFNIRLPVTGDENYQSLETLLFHVLRSSGRYMIWICDKLNLDNPHIEPAPHINEIQNKAGDYLNYLLEKWRLPLVDVPEDSFRGISYQSNWGDLFCIEAMMEHAVLHPIRHEFQLKNLIKEAHK
jgi:hypothetical protein